MIYKSKTQQLAEINKQQIKNVKKAKSQHIFVFLTGRQNIFDIVLIGE